MRPDALVGDSGLDATLGQRLAAPRIIVALVGMELDRRFARATLRPPNRPDRIKHSLEHRAIVAVGASDPDGEQGAAPVDNHMALGARFASISGIRPAISPPRGALMIHP